MKMDENGVNIQMGSYKPPTSVTVCGLVYRRFMTFWYSHAAPQVV